MITGNIKENQISFLVVPNTASFNVISKLKYQHSPVLALIKMKDNCCFYTLSSFPFYTTSNKLFLDWNHPVQTSREKQRCEKLRII